MKAVESLPSYMRRIYEERRKPDHPQQERLRLEW